MSSNVIATLCRTSPLSRWVLVLTDAEFTTEFSAEFTVEFTTEFTTVWSPWAAFLSDHSV